MMQLQVARYSESSLHQDHAPNLRSEHKRVVYNHALATRSPSDSVIEAIRWAPAGVPAAFPTATPSGRTCEIVPGVFDYLPGTSSDAHWYVNFADPELFVAYGTPLLAQDELQVAEHPALGCLREALISDGYATSVEDEHGRPTPFTIVGVPRRVMIDTTTGLYGNAFSRASLDTVRQAICPVDPEVQSNILAIAAPRPGHGTYHTDEITAALVAAYTGFAAARAHLPTPETTVHTGFWGCGAFGGNRALMTMLQVAAAEAAGVNLVFHAFDDAGVTVARDAYAQYKQLRTTVETPPNLIETLYHLGFEWGESDGN